MFAKGSSNADYHLLRADEEQTLCGRIVAPIIIDQPVKSSHLHLTTAAPVDCSLCEGCAALSARVMAGSSSA
ncbi:MAG TPA: hypothetical protein DC054_10530 [Blastocatellia bacterium]|nr:hypothetical protein [Blastocatellia bacterium]